MIIFCPEETFLRKIINGVRQMVNDGDVMVEMVAKIIKIINIFGHFMNYFFIYK